MRVGSFVSAGLVLVSLASAFAQSPITPPGSGTSGDPYQISEVAHLVWMGNEVGVSSGKYYAMTADIDASPTAGWNDSGTSTSVLEGFKPIGKYSVPDTTSFRGIFDGAGHTISGLVANRSAPTYVGLFGYVGAGGQVRNLGMVGGSLAGSTNVGGLIGGAARGTVFNCWATGTVNGSLGVGGLVGQSYGTMSNCYATGAAGGTGPYGDTGGLLGTNRGVVSNCYATGAVTGIGTYGHTGGLVGYNYGTLSDCYATGAVMGTGDQSYVDGLAGVNNGTVSNSYWDMDSSGFPFGAGTGKATPEMKLQATFAGWDFTNVWGIVEGSSYPYLRSSPPPFKLTVQTSGPGSVAIDPPSADGMYAPGTLVTLTAIPSGLTSAFIRWVAVTPNEPTKATVVMDVHRSVTAVFGPRIEINSLADLAKIGNDPGYPLADAVFVLTADIDASATARSNDSGTSTTILEGFKPIGTRSSPDTTSFRGIFDGKGHSISGLVINRSTTNYVGLFGCVGTGGQVRDVSLVRSAITGNLYVGGLIGLNYSVTLSSCRVAGRVTGNLVGGLIGTHSSGIISNCCATAAVTGSGDFAYVGGLVGFHTSGAISNCAATGTVTGPGSYSRVGGLIGENFGPVSNCYATGAVVGAGSSSVFGGLIGEGPGTVSDSYWNNQSSGRSTSAGGTGLTTAEMKQQTSFAGWDFASAWGIVEDVTYPFLRNPFDADSDGVHDTIDACPGTVYGATVDVQGCPPAVFGDFDHNGAVNQADVDVFTTCVTGPTIPYDPAHPPSGCTLSPVGGFLSADHDHDGDVDQEDFGVFQRCHSGVAPANPSCAG